jgi:hypothetical protein
MRSLQDGTVLRISGLPEFAMDHLITLANGLFIFGYLVRDLLWLRTLACSGACCLALYFASRDEPLMHVVYWNVFFAALNGVWILWLIYEKRKRSHKNGDRTSTAREGTAAGASLTN